MFIPSSTKLREQPDLINSTIRNGSKYQNKTHFMIEIGGSNNMKEDSISNALKQLVVYCKSKEYAVTWNFRLYFMTQNQENITSVPVTLNIRPQQQKEDIMDGKDSSYKYQVKLEFNLAKKFSKLDQRNIIFQPGIDDCGFYNVRVYISDDDGEILKIVLFSITVEIDKNKLKCKESIKCNPQITQVTMDGQIYIKFPQSILETNSTQYQNISKDLSCQLKLSSVVNASIEDFYIKKFTRNLIILQLKLVNPQYISQSGFLTKYSLNEDNSCHFYTDRLISNSKYYIKFSIGIFPWSVIKTNLEFTQQPSDSYSYSFVRIINTIKFNDLFINYT
ncbi:UNKNOWN [Stylonychia lemnae]|uniref:Uncharacterized protein n=1 Tax=Stylonychia lemnae TaxID=5949 RepID=A0A078B2R3_STYLE|nr:UNKNOWN [Stylonychia lemnae]|eukprot:CDW88764.1 UNKNOWN [Stylonychia lemnae]